MTGAHTLGGNFNSFFEVISLSITHHTKGNQSARQNHTRMGLWVHNASHNFSMNQGCERPLTKEEEKQC